ncbi:hypothetical protein CONPUDRAFT_149037 [Coniophora puteana RWD-64-598 SS2]|uniref:CASTOR ACT domain-containing protein n=1 Tax=Coniophora puteana (strain RWD-64-598) TaxID=741705 RepID=A0A5M3N6C6_CONPW|nr:uncharacterized protein CONPUDRAFT_149037 [Coniophora puteana RWD-64-598 SS2]EIW86992.1 hypothetical protein CONPUDRAFT_149037 [Coniophora puteana RWD-64-598 SS2]
MPPPIDHECLHLEELLHTYAIEQLPPGDQLSVELLQQLTAPRDPKNPGFVSISQTHEEISIVRQASDGEWRGLKIAGPMDFGIICNLTKPLQDAGVGVFVTSTWNTDYVLVKKQNWAKAREALVADGWKFTEKS